MSTAHASPSIADRILGLRNRTPHHPWLATADGAWLTVEQTVGAALGVAERLAREDARPGDRIVIALTNSPAFRLLELAALLTGMVRVALTPRLHPREVARIAADCDARVICCDPGRVEAFHDAVNERGLCSAVAGFDSLAGFSGVDDIPRRADDRLLERRGTDPAMLLYTSGTTGAPKGASVSHRAWLAQLDLALEQLPSIGPDDRVLAVAPMAHFGGSMALDAALVGASTLTMARFSPVDVLDTVLSDGITVLPLAPIMVAMLAESAPPELVARAARQLRAIPYGGSPLAFSRLVTAARAFPGLLHQYYGLSETLAPVAALLATDHDRAVRLFDDGRLAEAEAILSSAGAVARGTQVRIDPVGEAAGHAVGETSEPGRLSVRSPLVTDGYWGPQGELRPATNSEGWFPTGDLGNFDAAGRLHLHGRGDDMIISGGFNVIPAEVESVIRTVEGVADVAVVGVPDDRWGQRVHATLVLGHPTRPLDQVTADIEAACRAAMAAFKRPLSFDVVPELPRTALDKVDRRALRARLAP
ncbi:MAG: hypothetical protein BGO26_20645 [Actinobacteria bacterium 69-20]|jgi:acyl-CoA synthetase (AMP-forming)/AMP-acid ligase II|nr:acyl--CoA ligase [Actinomycetota bacterium]OJV24894.1 MAG: hypothetical protein BGO26_20645 [Actinobacteria bacterium 69-20]